MKRLVILASMLLASGVALATNNPHDEGNDRGSNSSSSATGGSVKGSGNSSNRNSNRNTNQQTQSQQAEARAAATASSTASSAATAANNGNGSNNTKINYNTQKQPVSTAYATNLTSGYDTCLGSVAGGVQSSVLGLSAGGTKLDKNCILIKQVQLLTQMGYKEAACYRARAGEEGKAIDEALTAAGVDCKLAPVLPAAPEAPAAAAPEAPAAPAIQSREELNEAFKKAVQK